MKPLLIIGLLFITTFSSAQNKLQAGYWHAEMKLNDTTILPFVFEMFDDHLEIINADERIRVDEIVFFGDSVFIQMPVYETEIRCKYISTNLEGHYINHTRTTNSIIPFKAMHGMGWRFSDRPEKTTHNISGRWHVSWDKEEGENKMAIGIFNQDGNRLTGTFLTATGDYRFLEGEIGGSHVHLSSFDASHAYLFDAIIHEDGTMQGNYFSGSHWHDTWKAWRSDEAELVDPESMTYLKPGYERINFSFPDENGDSISLSDTEYLNKVVIVQLMGTWCSNCLDETKFLVELSMKYHKEPLKIIALDFEKTNDSFRIKNNIRRIKDRLHVAYPILYAGSAIKEEAAKSLAMLNRIAAFPTTIVIDKKGKVRKIYTGFSGPASGKTYTDYTESFSTFLENLFQE